MFNTNYKVSVNVCVGVIERYLNLFGEQSREAYWVPAPHHHLVTRGHQSSC